MNFAFFFLFLLSRSTRTLKDSKTMNQSPSSVFVARPRTRTTRERHRIDAAAYGFRWPRALPMCWEVAALHCIVGGIAGFAVASWRPKANIQRSEQPPRAAHDLKPTWPEPEVCSLHLSLGHVSRQCPYSANWNKVPRTETWVTFDVLVPGC